MGDVDVVEVTGYQWQCPDCFDCGVLETSEEFAREAGGDHRCPKPHDSAESDDIGSQDA